MALPNGLAQINDLGSLLGSLGRDIVDIPLIAVPYTSIQNRSYMSDLSKDLAILGGVNRIQTQQAYLIQDEFGPNGDSVWGSVNDTYNQIRFVGNVDYKTDNIGSYIRVGTIGADTTSYAEITFYGTGLNLLTLMPGAVPTAVASVNNGSEGANFLPNQSTANTGRGYAPNIRVTVVSGLTLGTYTVRMRKTSVAALHICGFEIVNDISSIKVNPGTLWKSGQKRYNPAQTTFTYNSGFESGSLGSRGGRVAVYQKSNGSIAKAVTPTDSSQLNMGSASHTNEEIARTYNWREFGAGRNDDFSTYISSSPANLVFTIDDAVTTLVGSGVRGDAELYPDNVNNYVTFTFVGTGLDVIEGFNNAGPLVAQYTVSIDSTTISSGTVFYSGVYGKKISIVSGLPYGTHTFRLLRTSVGLTGTIKGFVVYQPKTPTIPSDAALIGAYNILGNYSATAALSGDACSAGIVKYSGTRDITFFNAWSTVNAVAEPLGVQVTTVTNGASFEFSFYGTNVEIAGRSGSGTNTMQVQIDGALYTGAATALGAGATWTPGTSTYLVSNSTGARLQISGLSTGRHTIRLTKSNGIDGFNLSSIDVATTIHSHKSNGPHIIQNTLSVGSQGIDDRRKISSNVAQKISAQANFANGTIVNTSTAYMPLTDTSLTVTTGNSLLDISFYVYYAQGAANTAFLIYVDGLPAPQTFQVSNDVVGSTPVNGFNRALVPVAAGTHKIDIHWKVNSSSSSCFGRVVNVREIKD